MICNFSFFVLKKFVRYLNYSKTAFLQFCVHVICSEKRMCIVFYLRAFKTILMSNSCNDGKCITIYAYSMVCLYFRSSHDKHFKKESIKYLKDTKVAFFQFCVHANCPRNACILISVCKLWNLFECHSILVTRESFSLYMHDAWIFFLFYSSHRWH